MVIISSHSELRSKRKLGKSTRTTKTFRRYTNPKQARLAKLTKKFQNISKMAKSGRITPAKFGLGHFFSTFSHNQIKELFRKSVQVWNLQPLTGANPIYLGNESGPRPVEGYWLNLARGKLNHYQGFMQDTLRLFIRGKIPLWAMQEWDIELTVVTTENTFVFEKRNYITTYIDPKP